MLDETGMLQRHFRSGVKLQGRSKPKVKASPEREKEPSQRVVVAGRAVTAGHGSVHGESEGSHERRITAKEQGTGKQLPIGLWRNSEGLTLGMLAGWNKLASCAERKSVERLRKPMDGLR